MSATRPHLMCVCFSTVPWAWICLECIVKNLRRITIVNRSRQFKLFRNRVSFNLLSRCVVWSLETGPQPSQYLYSADHDIQPHRRMEKKFRQEYTGCARKYSFVNIVISEPYFIGYTHVRDTFDKKETKIWTSHITKIWSLANKKYLFHLFHLSPFPFPPSSFILRFQIPSFPTLIFTTQLPHATHPAL